ncbi:forkhead box protein N3-like isoform X1 [Argopecten irradians]|uniref:forkhead box protein N3-like isoform X1 n=2 Tax=Argopecten irradians TaxID=31199 RepID=UPI00371646E9
MKEIDNSVFMTLLTMAPTRAEESDAHMRERLVNSLSQSFPGSALSRALQCMQPESDDEDFKLDDDMLSSSCFAELRLEKGPIEDDDLTSLSWLQDTNLLQNINAEEDEENSEGQKENGDSKEGNHYSQSHPPHVPYNPQKHVNSKPPYSFSCLIFMAIEDSPQKKLPVKDIYSWILGHFPYFQHAPTGWKNSVRHNLSLNKCFKKVDKDRGQSIGKGSLWCIDPDYRPNLLQALRKTPYHPYHQLQMLANPQPSHQYSFVQNGPKPLPLTPRLGHNSISPHLFPFLSKRLAQSNCDIDSDIQDVAHTLVSLKSFSSGNSSAKSSDGEYSPPEHQRMRLKRKQKQLTQSYHKRRNLGDVICTLVPSEDHTYSVTNLLKAPPSPGSSIDEEYDFGDEDEEEEFSEYSYNSDEWESADEVDGSITVNNSARFIPRKNTPEEEAEEQKKIVEGADALLNLAGIKTNGPSSPVVNSKSAKRNTPSSLAR